MTRERPWDVRHICTTSDPRFKSYLTELGKVLEASKRAGEIQELHVCRLGENSGISPAIQTSRRTELVIVDLHGWIDKQCPWLTGLFRRGCQVCDKFPVSGAPT